MTRVTTDRQLLVSALSDAIDWTESLTERDASAEKRLANYLAEWKRITKRSYHEVDVTARSVALADLPLSDHFCTPICKCERRRTA